MTPSGAHEGHTGTGWAFAAAFAEALRRVAAEKRARAEDWRGVARMWTSARMISPAEGWAAEHDALAQLYEEWSYAVGFPGGPAELNFIRYGVASRNSFCEGVPDWAETEAAARRVTGMGDVIAATRRDDGLVDECWDCGKTTEYECPRCSMPVCQDCAANGDHAENCA